MIRDQQIKQSALLLIEFQNEWLSENGKLQHLFQDRQQFVDSIANAEQALLAAREINFPVIHSGLAFTENYPELGMAKYGIRSAIRQRNTFLGVGSNFPEPFKPKANEFLVTGRIGSSAFAGSNLDQYLRNNHIGTLYLMGYAMHVCVESTLRAAHDLGYETILIEDASAAFTTEQKQYVINEVVHHFGRSMTTKEFLTILQKNR